MHTSIEEENVRAAKALHPDALILTHPECTKEVIELSDFVGSTSEIIDFATKSSHTKFIICTEMGVFLNCSRGILRKNFILSGTGNSARI